jgi:adrenodoxin-NADP+ reductase
MMTHLDHFGGRRLQDVRPLLRHHGRRLHNLQQSQCLRTAASFPVAFIQQRRCLSPEPEGRSILLTAAFASSMFQIRSNRFRSFSSTPSSSSSSSKTKVYKIAVVGSGPSGCYTAKYLKASWDKQQGAQAPQQNVVDDENNTIHNSEDDTGIWLQIDVIERLPTPYGLVRFGVAPDHPEVKNVQNDFDALFENSSNNNKHNTNSKKSATQIAFYGNVHVGRDVALHELRARYHAVVLATGCESNRRLGIPGEDSLEGILPAREFVAWYNGHPDFDHVGPIVQKALARGNSDGMVRDGSNNINSDDEGICHDAPIVVIGQGNVALDCARILAKGRAGLNDTDIATRALDVIKSGVSHVSIVGRRGHVQGAFTIKELRELVDAGKHGGASFVVRSDELEMGRTEASLQELETGRPKQRIDALLSKATAASAAGTLVGIDAPPSKRVDLRFLLSPCRFEPSSHESSSLGAVVCERTRLEGVAGAQRAVGTGEFESIPARLALVSIGYKGVAIPDMDATNGEGDDDNDKNAGFFDSKHGVARHVNGRIQGPITINSEGPSSPSLLLGGLYASGWFKRGPTGIIGTNIPDAKDTVATILQDLTNTTFPVVWARKQHDNNEDEDLKSLLQQRNIAVVTWEGYQRIVEKENTEKRTAAQPREKITSLQVQIKTALGGRHGGDKPNSPS